MSAALPLRWKTLNTGSIGRDGRRRKRRVAAIMEMPGRGIGFPLDGLLCHRINVVFKYGIVHICGVVEIYIITLAKKLPVTRA